jgi:hypothetical protein
MPLKALIISSAGFVGKSTTVASLLYPRLGPEVEVLSVEEANEDAGTTGIPVSRFLGTESAAVMQRVMLAPGNIIVDCGSSEFSLFVQGFAKLPGSINAFQAVIIPMTPNERGQREGISTIETLKSVGLQTDQIRVLFNQVNVERMSTKIEHAVKSQFLEFLTYAEVSGLKVNTDAALHFATIHMELTTNKLSLAQMIADHTDYGALLDKAVQERRPHTDAMSLARMRYFQLSARGVQANMDAVFKALRLPGLEPA